ncbi:MAG: phosphoribosylanthranilate isomerase [Chitinispirillales bacterium]|jgi:phosphoribosylanthranilate isomerase|nr:phosphoribosylanthranilate isomerase [Chitinispirillales bacterium]
MRIKICGITRYEDARVAANLGVDALGFIFAKESPRCIAPADAAEIIKRLPPFVSKVGVFVNEDPQRAFDAALTAGVDTVQFHGDETPEYCAQFPMPVIKAFSVGGDFDVSAMSRYKAAGYLLDTWDSERRGGSGRVFDWSVAAKACGASDAVILSGGLNPLNLREAIDAVHPYAVDLNSGVEISPGVKNPYKVKEVVSIARGGGG